MHVELSVYFRHGLSRDLRVPVSQIAREPQNAKNQTPTQPNQTKPKQKKSTNHTWPRKFKNIYLQLFYVYGYFAWVYVYVAVFSAYRGHWNP